MIAIDGEVVVSTAENRRSLRVDDGVLCAISQHEDFSINVIGIGGTVEDDFNTVTEDLGSGDVGFAVDRKAVGNDRIIGAFTVESQVVISIIGKEIGGTVVLHGGAVFKLETADTCLGIGCSGKVDDTVCRDKLFAVERGKSAHRHHRINSDGVAVQGQIAVRTVEDVET